MREDPSYITALHALVPEVKEKNICVIFDGLANVTYWEKYDAEPPSAEEILAEFKKQIIEWDNIKYYRDRKEYLPDHTILFGCCIMTSNVVTLRVDLSCHL